MIAHNLNDLGSPIRQGDRDWWNLRLGIPTCSEFGRVMTEGKREYSKAARAYAAELIAEQLIGRPLDWGDTGWTERGKELEDQARKWYELVREVDVERCAFITDAERTEGGSPDGLVGPDGIVEIKCYGLKHHMLCLLGEDRIASPLQTQGYLRLTGRKWVDCVAFNPDPKIPNKIERVWRDDAFIHSLSSCLDRFKDEMAKAKARLESISAGGLIEDDGLLAQLAASLAAKTGKHPDALTPDETKEMHEGIQECIARELLDESDAARILADINAGRWDDVRGMQDYVRRVLKVALVP